jgi:hypothetical protein
MTDDQRQEVEELEGRIAALKRELADVERPGPEREPELARPRDPERVLAERMLEHLNKSRTPWLGGDDAAA